jgi:hypothetical protein
VILNEQAVIPTALCAYKSVSSPAVRRDASWKFLGCKMPVALRLVSNREGEAIEK